MIIYYKMKLQETTYFDVLVGQFMNKGFPMWWISKRGSVEWLAVSLDLTLAAFFLRGHLKSKVYYTKINSTNLEELQQIIINECRLLTPDILIM